MGNLLEDGVSSFTNALTRGITSKVQATLDEQVKRVDDAIANLDKARPLAITYKEQTTTLPTLRHSQMEQLIQMVGRGLDVLIVGAAGTGKTHAAKQTAEVLSLPFYCQSVGAQTSKSDLLGYMDATGKYVSTNFRRAYEQGGVFVMDEVDAGNANVLIVLNSALSNSVCAFPDKMVERHADFKFIATANTYGNGASRDYVGRNQLDAATLDRFVLLKWKLDKGLEKQMVEPYKYGNFWRDFVGSIRKWTYDQDIKAILSPRVSLQGAILLESTDDKQKLAKDQFVEVCKATVLKSIPASNEPQVLNLARDYFNDHYVEL